MVPLTRDELKRFAGSPTRCSRLPHKVSSLADFLSVISDAIRTQDPFWFRGHEDIRFSLTPSALRFPKVGDRAKALALMADFKRVAELKLRRPPAVENELEWAQVRSTMACQPGC